MFEGKVLDFDEGVSLRDAVCGVLRAAILTGELEAGDRLMEIPLAEQMGVSRTPVRESIRRLEEEGLVIITPKCGARVASYTEKEVTDALDVRMHIESMSVKLAAMYITAEQVDILKEINKEMAAAVKKKKITAISEADNRLHNAICCSANNQVLLLIMKLLEEQVIRYRVEYIKSIGDYTELLEEHEELIKALENRDGDRAAEIVEHHIKNQKEKIKEIIAKRNV